jgi:AcrR family transcriptional regulator
MDVDAAVVCRKEGLAWMARTGRPKSAHDSRRGEIAVAACEAILESGLEKVRLADIGAQAGVTTGALQHYFRNKEELLLFVKNYLFDRIFEGAKLAAEQHEGPDRLRAMIHHMVPTNKESVKAFRMLEAFRGRAIGDEKLLKIQRKRDRLSLDMFAQEIKALQEQGHIPEELDVQLAALGLNALLDGLGALSIGAPRPFKPAEVGEVVERYLTKCIGLATQEATANFALAPRRKLLAS